MSENFKDEVQKEIVLTLPDDKDSIIAFLAGLTKAVGTLEIVNRRMNLCLALDSFDEGLKIVEAFKTLYPAEFELDLTTAKSGAKAGKQICLLQAPYGFSKQILVDFELMTVDGDSLKALHLKSLKKKRKNARF